MAPYLPNNAHLVYRETDKNFGSWRVHATDDEFILEAWSEGCMVGALMIMSCVTVANMRRGVLLHKLILLEVCHAPSDHDDSTKPFRPAVTRHHTWHVLLHVL
jgi:hypothetical protein